MVTKTFVTGSFVFENNTYICLYFKDVVLSMSTAALGQGTASGAGVGSFLLMYGFIVLSFLLAVSILTVVAMEGMSTWWSVDLLDSLAKIPILSCVPRSQPWHE